ncbi:MAG: DUF374 domain-containing protein [bacterium]|nr:DUF374 domain-containing protein [bacterium]
MVRLINHNNIDKVTDLICSMFRIQQYFTHITNVDYPESEPCIYAMWHAHQCCIYGLPNRERTNVMISNSLDGRLIADVIHKLFHIKTVRGSIGHKGAIQATKKMIDALKDGECGAIMVDGPRGPVKKVKKGIIKIAKLSGVPIVPVTWYSNNFNFVKFPTWDKFEFPILDVRLINLYGKPIYVAPDGDEKADEKARIELEASLNNLDGIVERKYNETYRFGLWKVKK